MGRLTSPIWSQVMCMDYSSAPSEICWRWVRVRALISMLVLELLSLTDSLESKLYKLVGGNIRTGSRRH